MRVFDIVGNMITKKAIIHNDRGIHVRPSQVISTSMKGYSGSITIVSDMLTIYDTNTMDILSLGLVKEDEITIKVEGPEEQETNQKLVNLFETEFDFPPR